jgi:D-3-phosphoglycerate dehydrogenase / 2-oxoglutarate reductase
MDEFTPRRRFREGIFLDFTCQFPLPLLVWVLDHFSHMGNSVLLTSCLFQNTPGPHSCLLHRAGIEAVPLRGPLPESELQKALGEFDALLCDNDDVTEAVLDKACPRLRLISKVGASTSSIDLAACERHGVKVATTAGINHHAVAEHTLGLILSLSRHIPAAVEALRNGRWRREPGNEMRGRHLGVVGMGRVGQEVARLGRCFGMEVSAYTQNWPEGFAREHGIQRAASLEELAASADVLSLHPALTPDTIGMVNRKLLRLMPPGALLVNTSRAALVDHPAVLESLESGHLGGFASDVPEGEPPDPDDALLRHPNAIITPHVGSLTYQSIPRLLIRAAENLVEFFAAKG